MSNLIIYKASAGSGKTYTLAVQYIKRLIEDPTSYRHILAVTFTNKATAEMKLRIMQQLYGLWQGEKNSIPYRESIKKEFLKDDKGDVSDGYIQEQAGRALLLMIHDYSHFRVETIDSFFQSVLKSLARELGLPANLIVDLNTDELVKQAVRTMMEKLKPGDGTLKNIMNFIDDKIEDNKSWNIIKTLEEDGKTIFKEEYTQHRKDKNEDDDNQINLTAYKKNIRQLCKHAEDELRKKGEEFETIITKNNLDYTDFRGGSSSFTLFFKRLKDGDFKNIEIKKRLTEAKDSPSAWTAKTSKNKDLIESLAESTLIELLISTIDLLDVNMKIINSCNLSVDKIDSLILLNSIEKETKAISNESNTFMLANTSSFLNTFVGDKDTSFIFEKIGASFNTIMIDEFQDTSALQWKNFLILLMETISQGYDSLIVGDIKQSIYRWRNGDWSIMQRMIRAAEDTEEKDTDRREGNEKYIEPKVLTLDTNFRSEKRIIEFNNALFEQLKEVVKISIQKEINTDRFTHAYNDVSQKVKDNAQDKGFVKIDFIEESKADDYRDKTLDKLFLEIKTLLEHGVEEKDIAILVRTKKNIPIIAEYFTQRNINIISAEAFMLESSVSVNILIDALRVINDATDEVAIANLIRNYNNHVINKDTSDETFIKKMVTNKLPDEFVELLRKPLCLSLYETLEECYRIFQLEKIYGQDSFVFSLLDKVVEYTKDNSSDIASFLEYWNEVLHSYTIPNGEAKGITIMSVHKSKGLEFHTVLIPYCDWGIGGLTSHRIWCKPKLDPFDKADILSINVCSKMENSIYRDDYFEELFQLLMDNINILYVALTRASKNLVIISRANKNNEMGQFIEKAIENIEFVKEIDDNTNDEQDNCRTFVYGEICPTSKKTVKDENKLTSAAEEAKVEMYSDRYRVEFRQSNDSALFISDEEDDNKKMINHGKLLHTLFSRIKYLDDVEGAIKRLKMEGVIEDESMQKNLTSTLTKAFSNNIARRWFDKDWEVLNECDILWDTDEGVLSRRPDRVIRREGEVVVIDFKFGQEMSKYKRQVKEYVDLINKMDSTVSSIRGYIWYVEDDKIVEVG